MFVPILFASTLMGRSFILHTSYARKVSQNAANGVHNEKD